MPRLFVALDLPDAIKESLDPLMRGLGDVRWLADDQLHLTLRFIGELDNGRTNEVVDALSLVPGLPFDLRLKGIGHFPPRGEPRVIWTGIERQPQLTALKRRIDRALQQAGLERDSKKYTPHVTLARLRRPPTQAGLATYLMRHSLFRSPSFPVSGFKLFSSWLDPDGADYQVEASYELVPGSEDHNWEPEEMFGSET
ncbi:MAG: RNA 2',3'-cyclic phosphodiesterase [Alphaproteobacteria bacterium]|nr:RNA 2',3'-cyclic phosphodiesterase [Alphaproteobacteria bacterium]